MTSNAVYKREFCISLKAIKYWNLFLLDMLNTWQSFTVGTLKLQTADVDLLLRVLQKLQSLKNYMMRRIFISTFLCFMKYQQQNTIAKN